MYSISRQLQKWPHIPEVREAFYRTPKCYNKQRKYKARQFKEKMLCRLDELKDNDLCYWKLLKSLRENQSECTNDIELNEWKFYCND